MPVIIDGYNLLWSIHKTLGESESVSDIRLCRLLSKYLERTGQKGEIIFDGPGPRDKAVFDNMRDLEVVFSGLGIEADAVIEDKIKASTAPRQLAVVSNDRRLRRAARARRAICVKSEKFWVDVERQLRAKRANDEPAAKRGGLSKGETEQWLKFFGIEE